MLLNAERRVRFTVDIQLGIVDFKKKRGAPFTPEGFGKQPNPYLCLFDHNQRSGLTGKPCRLTVEQVTGRIRPELNSNSRNGLSNSENERVHQGSIMEKSSKRGKIPQSDWPAIMVRYEAGETLASIARTYDCSPPAISYIVSRSRARQPGAAAPIAAAEPQLLKAPEGEAAPRPIAPATAAASHAEGPGAPRAVPPAAAAPRSAEVAASGESRGNGPLTVALNGNGTAFRNGSTGSHERDAGFPGLPPRAVAPRPAPPSHAAAGPYNGVSAHPNGDRRTLHLSLGGNGGSNGAAHGNGPGPASANGSSGHATAERVEPSPPSSQPSSQRAAEDDRPLTRGSQPGRYGYPGDSLAERSLAPAPNQRREAQGRGAQGREASGTFIDGELRARVDADIAAFLAAFDGALAADTPDSRVALREATDRLLRAGARTRIELERLEARIPLAPRDSGRPDAAWRAR